jgi:hypothetical protein
MHGERIKNTNLVNIKKKLKMIYKFTDEDLISNNDLKKKQKKELFKWIEAKINFNKLFYYRGDEIIKTGMTQDG